MKKVKGYVGMTMEQYENLLIKSGKELSSWNVSNYDNLVYFWNVEKIMETEDLEKEEAIEQARRQAIWSGLTNVANFGSDYLVILELNLPENLIEDDDSCKNMEQASCIHINDFDNNFIWNAEKAEVSMMLYPFILAGVTKNEYFVQQYDNILLNSLVEAVEGNDMVYDLIDNDYYLEFERMDTNHTLKEAI